VFGTDMAAAVRWAPLLGNRIPENKIPQDMPPTAFSGGPVVLGEFGEKPEWEYPELFTERELQDQDNDYQADGG